MKKLIAIILCITLVFAVTAPAVSAADEERLPTVYIRGNGEKLYNADGTPLNADFAGISLGGGEEGEEDDSVEKIVEAVVNILKPFVLEGMLFDNWDNYGRAIYDELAPLFKDSGLDENGNAKNGTGVSTEELEASTAQSKTSEHYIYNHDYNFVYDWRLSPYDHVDRLHQFITDIISATGKSQVNIYARCIGGSLLMAYLEKYGHLGHVKNVMFVEVLSNGSTVISKSFSGKVEFDDILLEKYLGQLDYCGTNGVGVGFEFPALLREIVFKTMDFFNQVNATNMVLGSVEKLYERLYEALIPAILHATGLATQVNFWTCVKEEDMNDALNLVFGQPGSELRIKYAGLIEKILYYREHISSDLKGYYDSLREKGIHFGFTANYGLLNAPFTEDADLQSDALVSLEDATFGATAAKIGKTLSDEYIAARIEKGKGKYISADKVVDLSTAYSPETTWVFKNAHHDILAPCMDVIRSFLNGTGETVDSVSNGVCFMIYNEEAKIMEPMTADNCGDLSFMKIGIEEPTIGSAFKAFVDFCKMFFKLIGMLFRGELDLGSLF